jgi:two-component system, cell cycle sensor histidine kinase and response regulator CckA
MSLVNISFTGQQTAGAVRAAKHREEPPVETIELCETSTEPPILILEPCTADVQSILQVIRGAGISNPVVIANDYEEFAALISTRAFAAVLSAFRLPSGNGLDALHFLRDLGHETPFLLVTGAIGEDAAVECVKQGVNDYILKEHMAKLPVALSRALQEKALRDANAEFRTALAQSEARNRELVEDSVYGIFRVSLNGNFVGANSSLLQMLACSSLDELQSLNLAEEIFRYPEHYVKLVASCRAQGLVQSAESEWRRKDGGLISVRIHLRYLPIPGPGDLLEGIVEDITEIRALEHQLQQAQKFESIGQLAGGIAHDFNNVVGAILGWSEIGYEQSRNYPLIAERFSRIRTQAERAAALTRELLAFARRQPMQPQAVDLNAVVSNFTSFLDKVIGRDIELKTIPGLLRRIHADPTQVEQVLMNLCLNGRDAMPDGGRLTIETELTLLDEEYCRLRAGVEPGQYVVLSVSDTGIGMNAETRERVFEPFFTTKERGKGTGMGLATVYGIVKQHNGFIQVYSEPGQGSLFRVYFPSLSSDAAEKGHDSSLSVSPVELRGTEIILFAEDHDSIREMVRQALISFGYRVLAATDGRQALSLCETDTPAMAVLDIVMPRMGGPATAIELLARFPKLPILFTSGYTERSASAEAELSSSHYLQKPYSPTALGRVIRQMLGEAPTATPVS